MGKWRRKLFCLGMVLSSLLVIAKNNAPQLYIVIHEGNDQESVSQYDLANIFLGKQTLWDGDGKIYPVMLRESKESMAYFIGIVLNKSVTQYRSYWKKRLFSGGGVVPKTFNKHKNMLKYVSGNEGAIGVTDVRLKWKGVKYIPLQMVVKN